MGLDITPADLFDKRPVPSSQPAEDTDFIGSVERIMESANKLIDKVAMARGLSLQPGTQPGQQGGGGFSMADIKTALETVKSVKGDIPISELLKLLSENAGLIEGVLKK